jgi:hypothetical protein
MFQGMLEKVAICQEMGRRPRKLLLRPKMSPRKKALRFTVQSLYESRISGELSTFECSFSWKLPILFFAWQLRAQLLCSDDNFNVQ